MINPFIELWRNPVAALTWLGYALLMLGIVAVAVPWAVRRGARLMVQYRKNRHGDKWWSFGDSSKGYIPPAGWLWSLFWIIMVLTVAAWALGTIVYLIGGA